MNSAPFTEKMYLSHDDPVEDGLRSIRMWTMISGYWKGHPRNILVSLLFSRIQRSEMKVFVTYSGSLSYSVKIFQTSGTGAFTVMLAITQRWTVTFSFIRRPNDGLDSSLGHVFHMQMQGLLNSNQLPKVHQTYGDDHHLSNMTYKACILYQILLSYL